MHRDEYVQPIMLRRTGTHEDAVTAAAAASVTAYANDPTNPAWDIWLAQPFAKSVRRAKPAVFARLAADAPAVVDYGPEHAAAAAYAPIPADSLPRELAKLQVSGTDLPREGWEPMPHTPRGPILITDEDLPLTTGKACAQAAHALFAWTLRNHGQRTITEWLTRKPSTFRDDLAAWHAAGSPFHVTAVPHDVFLNMTERAPVVIRDAGRTEIEPGTVTFIAIDG